MRGGGTAAAAFLRRHMFGVIRKNDSKTFCAEKVAGNVRASFEHHISRGFRKRVFVPHIHSRHFETAATEAAVLLCRGIVSTRRLMLSRKLPRTAKLRQIGQFNAGRTLQPTIHRLPQFVTPIIDTGLLTLELTI